MDFLKNFKKEVESIGLEEGALQPPRYWYSTGNYVLNKLLSGDFFKGVPQGRITAFVGPSGTGKSLLISSIIREAQKEDTHVVVLDSENALDNEFVKKIGVDPDKDYTYVGVTTYEEVQSVVSAFLKGYKKEYAKDENAPKVLIVLDSLDMLVTSAEEENFEKGVTKGDQGRRAKTSKAMLRQFVQAIKHYNITMAISAQTYANQNLLDGRGLHVVNDALQYSLSQIALLTKLKLRSVDKKEIQGIRMKVEGYKTRFTKPFQTATIEIPYDTGIDPYNGLLDVALNLGLVVRKGARYALKDDDTSWFSKDFNQYAKQILELAQQDKKIILDDLDIEIDEDTN